MNWKQWAGFTALCGWSASGWLVPSASGAVSPLERLGWEFGVIALVAVALGGLRGKASRWPQRAMVAVGGLLFFALPAMLIEHGSQYATETGVAITFAFVPVVVTLAWGAMAQGAAEIRRLVPTLMGLAGVLLLLPFEMPVSWRAWEGLAEIALAMLLVAGAGVWLYGLSREMREREVLAIIAGSNALLLLVGCGLIGPFEWRWRELSGAWSVSLASLLALVLTVWLIEALEPIRFSARFLVIPLVTILEGLVLLRPAVTVRMVAGVLLLGGGAAWMLTAKRKVDEEVLSLR